VAESVRVGIAARRKQRGIGPELQVLENAYRICKAQERREILPRGKEGFVGNGYARSRMQENIRSETLRVQGDGVAEASIIRARMYGEKEVVDDEAEVVDQVAEPKHASAKPQTGRAQGWQAKGALAW